MNVDVRPLDDAADTNAVADQLEPLVAAAFGRSREPGWLHRKLHREVVDPSLSAVAELDGVAIGFVFAGRPASMPSTVRTAGLGVHPDARRRGVATRLLTWTLDQARRRDGARVRCLAEPSIEPLYTKLGFEVANRRVTLGATGRAQLGTDDLSSVGWPPHRSIGEPSATVSPTLDLTRWLREAWERTPPEQRAVVSSADGAVTAWVSLESGGWLIQRLAARSGTPPSAIVAALGELVNAAPRSTQLFCYGCPEPFVRRHGLVFGSARDPGGGPWHMAQRFAVMQRFTTNQRA